MKFLLALFLMVTAAHAQQKLIQGDLYVRRGTYQPLPDIFSQEELNRVLFSDSRLYQEDLKKVKYYLVNGELQLAKVYLQKLTFGQIKLKPITYRYLGMIAFIEGEYAKSMDYLSYGELKNPPNFARVCGIIVLDKIVLNDVKDLQATWDRCRTEALKDINVTNYVWLDTLVKLKLNPVQGITKDPFLKLTLRAFGTEDVKIILKLALYLNQEALVVDQIPELTTEQLQDPDLRELAGHIFFRSGKFANAYKFIEDIKSPNSENIKGNLYVLRGKYEIGYAQFKLALKEKQNSQNALERLVPLAWLLGDWQGGIEYSQRLITRNGVEANKQTIMAAFYLQKGSYKKAKELLTEIKIRSRRGSALEVNQIGSFVALMENDPDDLKDAASTSCELNDIVNCWVFHQMYQWDSFPLVVRRGDDLPHKEEWKSLTQEKVSGKLTEPTYVYQQDIEELDDKMIRLIK